MKRNLVAVFLWLLLLITCLSYCTYRLATGPVFYSDLFDLLPTDQLDPVQRAFSLKLAERFQDRGLILLRDDGPEAIAQLTLLHTLLHSAQQLEIDQSGDHYQAGITAVYRPFSQQLLSSDSRRWLQESSATAIAERTLRDLYAPFPLPRPYPFTEDPFNLGSHWIRQVTPKLAAIERQGHLAVIDTRSAAKTAWLMIPFRVLGSPFSAQVQRQFNDILEQFRQRYPNASLLTSGMIFHAAAGTAQAKREISTVGAGSLIGIVLLITWVFRSPTPLLAVLLNLASSSLIALTACLLVFGQIHMLTLTFGATLLGIAIDYIFHFLVTSHHLGNPSAARRHLSRPMAIGALTTIAAFSLQLTTPFPGLQQIAVYSAAGLAGAWLMVMALGPSYPRRTLQVPLTAATSAFTRASALYARLQRAPVISTALLLAIAGTALLSIWRGGSDDNIANLNTSSGALIAAEARVQSLMQFPSSNRYLLVQAEEEEALLQRLEMLTGVLEEQFGAQHNSATQLQSLNQWIPSQHQQQEDRALVQDKLYSEHGAFPILCRKLALDCSALPAHPIAAGAQLSPDTLQASALQDIAPPTLGPSALTPSTGGPSPVDPDGVQHWYSLVLIAAPGAQGQLATTAERMEGVRLVDQAEHLSDLLGHYRQAISRLLLLTLTLLIVLLAVRYRRAAWRIMTPLTLSLLVALGVAAIQGITVFHLMALLVILGIGLDTAIFYQEVGFTREPWLASTLSSFTSILAFGLLSLSAVPILKQFGVVILSGMFCCWSLTPLFFESTTKRITP